MDTHFPRSEETHTEEDLPKHQSHYAATICNMYRAPSQLLTTLAAANLCDQEKHFYRIAIKASSSAMQHKFPLYCPLQKP
jgi:hypothetical protein